MSVTQTPESAIESESILKASPKALALGLLIGSANKVTGGVVPKLRTSIPSASIPIKSLLSGTHNHIGASVNQPAVMEMIVGILKKLGYKVMVSNNVESTYCGLVFQTKDNSRLSIKNQ